MISEHTPLVLLIPVEDVPEGSIVQLEGGSAPHVVQASKEIEDKDGTTWRIHTGPEIRLLVSKAIGLIYPTEASRVVQWHTTLEQLCELFEEQ